MAIQDCFDRLALAFAQKVDDELLSEWVDALDGATDDEMNEAASRLIKTSKFMPRIADFWNQIDLIRVERAPAPDPISEHWRRRTYDCPDCEDTGLRTVWHPKAMSGAVRYVRGKLGERAWRGMICTCTVKCVCNRGKERRLRKQKQRFEAASYQGENYEPGELTYNPSIMREVDKRLSSTQQVEALLDWAKNYQDPKPANYVESFDEF